VVLLLAGCAVGALGVHSTTDLWIGLACGRYILTHGEVPTTDPFSFTFAGQPFFNQNWLSHAIFFFLYDRVAPSAVLIFIWLIDAAIYAYFLVVSRLRSGSWLAALLVAGVVAAVSRHYLDARPQTVGYACLAATCALLHYFLMQPARRRWWPALLLLPVFLLWGNAHGSFVFGYGLLGLFVGCWAVSRLIRRWIVPVARTQVVALCAAAFVAVLLTVALGPYGVDNFTHARGRG